MKTIVAAVDASHTSRVVFKEALVLAANLRARVFLVSVIPHYEGNMNRFCIDDAERELAEPFRQFLDQAVEYADSLGLELHTMYRRGKPGNEIVAVAREVNASLILLGSSRRHHVERMLSGRILAEVISYSHCDVLLLPEETEMRFTNLLVGISGSEASLEAEARAFDIALSYGSQVHGICSIDLPVERSLRYEYKQDAEWKARKLLQAFVERAGARDVLAHPAMSWDLPEKSMVEYVQEHDIHLIIIGSHRALSFFEVMGGSVSERLASITPCPVLVVKQSAPESSFLPVSAFCIEE
ncbi:universal stress protein [Desulfogranum japonicum]|uniref:universal stress protein n=1 Tax=Desulfogranum japonicum TaxID=231447 RepID=UPI0003F6E99B|nr:universal stress protein [Desulfogranum japonicum]